MSKLPKDKRDKIILVGMVTCIAAGGIWFALINAQRKALDNVRAQKATAEQRLRTGQAAIAVAAETENRHGEASAKLKICEAGMAASADMFSWFFETLNRFRAKYPVEIPQLSRETPSEVGLFPQFPYRAASFTVRGTAHYHEFGRFLADFENEFPYIRVQNIDLTPSPDVESSGPREQLSFTMDLVTLVRPIAP